MRKRVLAYLIATALLCSLGAVFLGCGKKQPDTIKIGVLLPLTGDVAQWGVPPKRGAELAVEEINGSGGIHGKLVQLVIEDSKAEPKTGVSGFRKIIEDESVKVVLGAAASGVTLAVAPVAEANEVVLISPVSTSPKVTTAGEFIFRVIPSDELRGKLFARYLYNDVGIRSVDILCINNEAGIGNKDIFSAEFARLGGKVNLAELYDQGVKDLRTEILKITKTTSEALVVISYPDDTVVFLTQAKELGLSKPLFFQTEAMDDPHVIEAAGNAAEGVVYIMAAQAEGTVVAEFEKKYEEKYGVRPELYAAEGYDIIKLAAAAMSHSDGEITGASIRDYLYKVKGYEGASGNITFDKNGDVLKPMAIKTVKEGGKREVVTIIE